MSTTTLDTPYLRDRVARWQAGDQQAADELLRTVEGLLRRLAGRMLHRNPHLRAHLDTGDVYQGSALRLLRTLRQFTPTSTRHFLSLAGVHVRRELIDLTRHFASAARRHAPLPDGVADPQAASPEDLELWARFHEAVDRLPEEEREVVELIFYQGGTQLDTAALLGVGERTVRRRWQAACLRLNEVLGGQFPVAGG